MDNGRPDAESLVCDMRSQGLVDAEIVGGHSGWLGGAAVANCRGHDLQDTHSIRKAWR
jgi:hypothetical protein